MSEIKKIFISHGWLKVGVNVQTMSVAEKLSEKFDITFLSQPRIGQHEIKINDHLKVLEWPSRSPKKLKDFLFLIKLLRKIKPEVIIVHFSATNLCMAVSWLLRVPYRVAWLHTLSEQYYIDSQNDRVAKKAISHRKFAYKLATHIICLNEYAKNDAVNNFEITPKKLFKIYNGIQQYGLPVLYEKKIKSIRYSGRLAKSKGIDILLAAFAIVYKTNKNIILEIAGKGMEEEAYLKTFIQKEGLENAIIFHGYLGNYQEAVNFIRNAYCFILPSRSDNFPTVVLEALSFGVPVIASHTGGIPEMFENEKEGFLVPKENAEALAEAMQKLIANESLRNEMSIQARDTFLRKYSMEQHVAQVLEFIDQLNPPPGTK